MTWFPPIIVAVGPPTRRRERNSTSAARRDPGACNPQGRPGPRTRSFQAWSCSGSSATASNPQSILIWPSQWLEDFLHLAVIRYQDFCHRLVVSYDGCHGEHRAGLCFLHARNDVRQRGLPSAIRASCSEDRATCGTSLNTSTFGVHLSPSGL